MYVCNIWALAQISKDLRRLRIYPNLLRRSPAPGPLASQRAAAVLTLFCRSSQDNINVDEAARFLVENILANDKGLPYEESNGERIKLDQVPIAAEPKSGCC